MDEDRAALERRNSDRIVALQEKGLSPARESLVSLRILCYLETLLADVGSLDEAKLHFERELDGQLTGVEAQADQMLALQRQARFLNPPGAPAR